MQSSPGEDQMDLEPRIYALLSTPIFNSLSTEDYDQYRSSSTPLIIDNGSTNLRYGFATSKGPHSGLNVIAKYRERKQNKPLLLFGENIDVESGAKSQSRTPWEGDVLLNFDALEHSLDYAFTSLRIDTRTVEHPVFMSERLSSPLHSRTLTSELLFELYSVPSVAYGVDSVMSFYHNNLPVPSSEFSADGLVLSFNTASTSVIPILNGKGLMSNAKRIPWGSSQCSEYLLKLIQLKYPNFPTRVTTTQSNWMLHTFCEFSTDYPALLRSLKDPLRIRSVERVIQFPFVVPLVEEKTEEELARAVEKRREQGRRLQEMAAKTRVEKLIQKENDFQYLTNLRESRGSMNKKDWQIKLQGEGFEDDASLDESLKKIEGDLKRARKKETDADEVMEEPTFPLVDVPDADLDEEGIREKKKQRLMKAGFDARVRAKKEKEKEREEKEAGERREEQERERDLASWAGKLRSEQEALMLKIKERNRRKAALGDRKSAAAQARMKNIANLASDDRVPKKKRKAGAEDMFGADDADWAIYRKINTAAPSSDEEEDIAHLEAIETKLLTYDPTFTAHHTHASLTTQRSALISAFRPQYEDGDFQGATRIHLNLERWRVCEAWFNPSMTGVDSAGLGEVMQNVLAGFSDAEKGRLANNIFLTGGPSQITNLVDRVHSSLRPILPPEMPINIACAHDPSLDAWAGMADFAKTDAFSDISVTREEYEEWGGERIKRWWGGNWNASVTQ